MVAQRPADQRAHVHGPVIRDVAQWLIRFLLLLLFSVSSCSSSAPLSPLVGVIRVPVFCFCFRLLFFVAVVVVF